jgi:hypothetical protein
MAKMIRKHSYNDYNVEDDICYDKVKISNKQNPYEHYTGWIGKCDNRQFIFEHVDVHGEDGYVRDILLYDDWCIEYL